VSISNKYPCGSSSIDSVFSLPLALPLSKKCNAMIELAHGTHVLHAKPAWSKFSPAHAVVQTGSSRRYSDTLLGLRPCSVYPLNRLMDLNHNAVCV
jgi:hypothetical protein